MSHTPRSTEDHDIVLVVIDPRPATLLPLLTAGASSRALTWDEGDGAGRARGPDGLDWCENAHGTGRRLVWIPTDGPRGAILTVVAGVAHRLGRDRSTVVVPDTGTGPPPVPDDLREIASLSVTPGVALGLFEWVTDDVVWLPGPHGIEPLRHDLRGVEDNRELARILLAAGIVEPASPGGRTLRHVGSGRTVPSRDTWSALLRAAYVETSVATLATGGV